MRSPVGPRALLWLTIALAAVSVGLAAGPLPWRFAGESGLPAPAPQAPGAPAVEPVSLDPILALSPFGRLAEPALPEAAVETSLGLTLHGVVIAARPDASSAIISSESEPARAYSVGQSVTDAASLAEVESDHVVLSVGDRREILSFPETRRGAASSGDSGVAALRALVAGGKAASDARPDADPGAAPTVGVGPEAMIADYRARIRANPQTVLDSLGLAATGEGYRVAEGAPAGMRRAGLRPGDVVAKINGQQVGDIERDRALFDDVAASGRARIEVLRGGQRIVLSFPLR